MNETTAKENVENVLISDKIVVIGGNEKTSLQDSFAKFLKEKKQERKLMKQCLQHRPDRSEEFKDQLRQKFIDRAKFYMGVPYAKKYQPEGAPDHPLYLDCCGLVRQVLKDLQSDFGFVIGKWNQAYQFDTLPIRVESVKELKPGDLIFYAGTYTSKRSKVQKHDMVHVEIFLGGETGEATIGARYQKGTVQIFPSYLFPSKLWNLEKVYFCSIDTWLNGQCVSVCPEHQWISSNAALAMAAGSRSIFHDSSDDESAGGCSDVEDEEMEHEKEETIRTEDQDDIEAKQINSIPVAETSAKGGRRTRTAKRLPRSRSNPADTAESASRGSVTAPSVTQKPPPPFTYYVGEGNGWRFIKNSLDRRGWQQLPFEYAFSTRFALKWVERRSQIDFKAHHSGQLVNHIPNNDVITTKIGLLTCLRDHYASCSQSSRTQMTGYSALLDTESPVEVLATALTGNATQDIPKNTASNIEQIASSRLPTPWMPETYQLDDITDCLALLDADMRLSEAAVGTTREGDASVLWIYKPSCSNRGRGVRVMQGGREIMELIREYHPHLTQSSTSAESEEKSRNGSESPARKGATYTQPLPKGIVQEYIMRPLLVDGYKFDLRVYMLIAQVMPHTIVYFYPGYARRTLKPYTLDLSSLEDSVVHLSNTSIQKKSSDFKEHKDSQILTREELVDAVERAGDVESAAFLRNKINSEMKKCMVDIIKASNGLFIKKKGYFDLLGLDFMVTSAPNNKAILLEANTNPALCVGKNELIQTVVDGTLDLVLAAHSIGKKARSGAGCEVNTPSSDNVANNIPDGFELIYDESTGYCFSDEAAGSTAV
mmetsp:Transcript_21428/g.31037  ORF Transcript_21428/g.31037 Transcript_21428/m.31037 type:complete len:826 (-) Transcript_21428:53-2530(-)|eukprot:CAMPEP_0185033194 /NCGR_PEP_ID=MMETSP1103-20130426/21953_1 /TAXON_ID=36769 /ORGANISM="Paraphysomonas bandaiensis, Strain Caron Lab Isolate" /LENGTH=825 /DNA_ID=CAMNT_0027569389 /DNA_START=125 /DNA_END=2602 /DNA_ORIENTATION=-